jgi:ATP-dependent helicase/nuclease subunit A
MAAPKSTRANTQTPASAAACKPSAAFRKSRQWLKTPKKAKNRRRTMNKAAPRSSPPDRLQREQALDAARSILVQAPAGSGKTTLLTERFLTLLGEVDDPGQIVAITFTTAAAAEMRNRILDELRNSEPSALARRALDRSNALGWKLLDLPAQLRISTIDSFCRDLALQQPLLSGLGGGLGIADQPEDLYRRAARCTLEQIGKTDDPALSEAVEELLKWRDNNWQELEDLLVDMLSKRDRWMHGFVLQREPDWDALRQRLEQPFANAVRDGLHRVSLLLDEVPGARQEALALARFACSQTSGELHRELAEIAEFPSAPFLTIETLEEAQGAFVCLAQLVLTNTSTLRKSIDRRLGFPSDFKPEKARILNLIADLAAVPGLESSLAAVRNLPPIRYSDDDWLIVRACFTLLRHAAAQLQVVFAEASAVDFIQVAQIALGVLRGEDGFPTDAALAVADGIRHLLVDEFQDTSRRQHQLLAGLIAAWPDRTGRTCFAVGDPMQSIYFFREADTELFARVREIGLEISSTETLPLGFVPLSANFRAAPLLVDRLNVVFEKVFAASDGSGVTFSPAVPARANHIGSDQYFKLHLSFIPQTTRNKTTVTPAAPDAEDPQSDPESDPESDQVRQIAELIRSYRPAMEEARAAGGKYRIGVLARARKSLAPIAQALHEAAIPFRAVDLEKLSARPEVLDALALARALLNPQDRVAWLGVLRAPWCGLTLDHLHLLTSADDSMLLARPVPDLLAERLPLLSQSGRSAAERVLSALASVHTLRATQPTSSLGTWLEQVWLNMGGADCCDPTAHANLDLLWSCLDELPAGAQDLLGPALAAALDKLTALPDPSASSDCGVQLMTIHKSKGLEFEVVIVPDLQAKTAGGNRKLLSWLERGLTPEVDSSFEYSNAGGEITEFLVAPLPSKGEDSGKSKAWVDRVYKDRESQETRRILYVAATRAREELHLFARPACKVEVNGDFRLVAPSAGLLATAWPALEGEIRARFDEWKLARLTSAGAAQATIESIAAAGESNLLVMPSAVPPAKPILLRRLPPEYRRPPANPGAQPSAGPSDAAETHRAPSFPRHFEEKTAEMVGGHEPNPGVSSPETVPFQLYSRHEGGPLSRALGTAVHFLLEQVAHIRATAAWPSARAALHKFEPRIAAQIRASGIAPQQAAQIAADALKLALNASHDPIGDWVLSPHPEAGSEVRWTGVAAGKLTNVRVDRVFRAGLTPRTEGQNSWWIIDYKTDHADNLDPAAALPQLRPLFAPQLEAYAKVLRNLHGADTQIRAGLYYPRELLLDWWQL